MTRFLLPCFCVVALLASGCGGNAPAGNAGNGPAAAAPATTDQEISDAYIYLMSRLLGRSATTS